MAKRKLNKASWSSVKVKHEMEIHDLLKKISDDEIKMKPIVSPKFNLGGVKMSIRVVPDYKSSGYISVFLHNYSNQDQTCSATFKADLNLNLNLAFSDQVRVKRISVDRFSFMDSLNFFGSNLGLWPGLGLYQILESVLGILLAGGVLNRIIAFFKNIK